METERRFAEYVCRAGYADLPAAAVDLVKDQVLAVVGALIGGASEEGCETVVNLARELGGKSEATILVHGGKVPAHQAAFVNGLMARALDFCDALAPGAHIGSAVIPAALAASELVGHASGADFLTAVCVGTEIGLRLNLGEAEYDGFDPTGVSVPFASTAAAAKIMGLAPKDTGNALALAFNRCGGSFQSNVDGCLAVRTIEGWVAETGVTCARLAGRGITGPDNYLDGIYGYLHLYGRDHVSADLLASGLGSDYHLDSLVFKKYPSCGATQGSTDAILGLMREEGLTADEVERVEISVPPYTHKLVGHPFHIGDNPKVDAQFSIRYCVANALVRGGSELRHFEKDQIRDPKVLELAERIDVVPDAALDARGHTALDLRLVTRDGREHARKSEIPPGFPGNPLMKEDHLKRFHDCARFAARSFPAERLAAISDTVARLEQLDDMSDLVSLLVRET
jgi:2-methylcitrate dehydratase PrpD